MPHHLPYLTLTVLGGTPGPPACHTHQCKSCLPSGPSNPQAARSQFQHSPFLSVCAVYPPTHTLTGLQQHNLCTFKEREATTCGNMPARSSRVPCPKDIGQTVQEVHALCNARQHSNKVSRSTNSPPVPYHTAPASKLLPGRRYHRPERQPSCSSRITLPHSKGYAFNQQIIMRTRE